MGTRDRGTQSQPETLKLEDLQKGDTFSRKKKHEGKPSYDEEAFANMNLELKRQVKVSNIDLEVIYIKPIVGSWFCPHDCTD